MKGKRTEALYLDASQVYRAVREMFGRNGYTVMSEVRNGTGYEKKARTADMLIVSTWPSRGLYCAGVVSFLEARTGQ